MEQFDLFGNYSYTKLDRTAGQNGAPYSRPMIGQSPFAVFLNLGLDYHVDKWNADFVLLYNKFGRRIVITGNRELFGPIWENPRPLLDFRYRQAISENLSITITFKDLINKAIIYYQDNNLNDDWDDIELISSDQIPSNIDHMRPDSAQSESALDDMEIVELPQAERRF